VVGLFSQIFAAQKAAGLSVPVRIGIESFFNGL
jgi:hypothetical protein